MWKFVTLSVVVAICGNILGTEIGPIEPKLKLIVNVDGKSFFADGEIGRNWTEAVDYCRSLGMQLATITSKLQADALDGAFGPDFTSVGTNAVIKASDIWPRFSIKPTVFMERNWNRNFIRVSSVFEPSYALPNMPCL